MAAFGESYGMALGDVDQGRGGEGDGQRSDQRQHPVGTSRAPCHREKADGEGEVEAAEFVKGVRSGLAITREQISGAEDELQDGDEEKTEPNRRGALPATRNRLLPADGGDDAPGQIGDGIGGREPSDPAERPRLLLPLPAPEARAEVVVEEVRADTQVFSVEPG